MSMLGLPHEQPRLISRLERRSDLDVILNYVSENTIRPSRDFTSDQYAIFLEIAKAYELETDTISSETYEQVCKETNTIPQKPEFPPCRII